MILPLLLLAIALAFDAIGYHHGRLAERREAQAAHAICSGLRHVHRCAQEDELVAFMRAEVVRMMADDSPLADGEQEVLVSDRSGVRAIRWVGAGINTWSGGRS